MLAYTPCAVVWIASNAPLFLCFTPMDPSNFTVSDSQCSCAGHCQNRALGCPRRKCSGSVWLATVVLKWTGKCAAATLWSVQAVVFCVFLNWESPEELNFQKYWCMYNYIYIYINIHIHYIYIRILTCGSCHIATQLFSIVSRAGACPHLAGLDLILQVTSLALLDRKG